MAKAAIASDMPAERPNCDRVSERTHGSSMFLTSTYRLFCFSHARTFRRALSKSRS